MNYAKRVSKVVPNLASAKIKSFSIPARNYASIKDVIDVIVAEFKKAFPTTEVTLTYSIEPLTGRVTFTTAHGNVAIVAPSEYLHQHLGYSSYFFRVLDGSCHLIPLEEKGLGRAYLDELYQIFVYSDIIDYQIVGNTKKPLMGVIPVKGKHGDQESWTFNPLQFGCVPKRVFSTIEIQLCTPSAALVPFLSGDTLSRIQFRHRIV